MNDRFKFRVWDKGNKRYQGTQDWQPYLDTDGDVCFINTDDVRDYPPENYFIIEQCTGLKDKNGNLIYEGDLIKTANYKTGLPEIYVVKWCADCGLYQLESTQSEQIIDMFRAEKGIIIGNIHEQAEQNDTEAD